MKRNLKKKHVHLVNEAYAHAGAARFSAARDAFHQALQFQPATADILRSLGGCCFECGQITEAIAYLHSSLELAPEDPVANVQLGICYLLQGHAQPGWLGLNYRKKLAPLPMPSPPPIPEWKGEALNGRGIAVLREQGYGDVLHFIRYIPLIKLQGGRVYLDVQPPLRRLLAVQPNLGTVLESGQKADISSYVYCMDLPMLFGDKPHGPDEMTPYIRLPNDVRMPMTGTDDTGRLRVGLAWAGSTVHGRDRLRSIGLQLLRPVLDMSDCQFFSLLPGSRTQDIISAGLQEQITNVSNQIEDFLDLATVIAEMDLIITVDTAVGHLAGAMGKPVWVLLCSPPDWRWGPCGSQTAWYSSMRLFRQPYPRDWATVVKEVASALGTVLRQRTSF